jgi:hypothetical protein
MSAWVPANGVERRLWDALQSGDLSGYFTTLGAAPLYLPGKASDGASGDSQWFGTIVREGTTYLPVFTSVEALRSYSEGVADAYRITNLAELVDRWPNAAWHLAVSPNLPIAVAGPPGNLAASADAGAEGGQPAIGPSASNLDELQSLALTNPAHRPERGRADPDGFLDLRSDRPEQSTILDLDPEPPFEAANPLESAMVTALAEGNTDLLLNALVLSPVLLPTDRVAHADDLERSDFPWMVGADENGPAIPVFTSPLRLAEAFGRGVPLIEVNAVRLARAWPDPAVRLWLNPGSPVTVLMSGAEVAQLVPWAAQLSFRAAEAGIIPGPPRRG